MKTLLLIISLIYLSVYLDRQVRETTSITIVQLQGLPQLNESNLVRMITLFKFKEPKTVLRMCFLETAFLTSKGCTVKNNLFGLSKNDKLISFGSWIESVLFFKFRFNDTFTGKGQNEYLQWLEGKHYFEDKEYKIKINNIKIK